LAGAALAFAAMAAELTPVFDPARYLEHVKFLASPKLKGRGDGMPELDKAADYVSKQFKSAGLQTTFQPFQLTIGAKLGPGQLTFSGVEASPVLLRQGSDFTPFSFSSAGSYTGGVVFAGYGISASEYGYDDYTHLDVKGKFVLILRHEPQEDDEKSPFAGKSSTRHSEFYSKAANAKAHGALGVILVNDAASHFGQPDELPKFAATGPNDAGIPFVQVKAEIADRWLRYTGKNLAELTRDIDKNLASQSFALSDTFKVTLKLDLRRAVKTVRNVAGYLPGETSEYVIVGAHYDHLGLGEQFSLAPSLAGTPHLGADDNASGTAAVIELARWFAKQPKMKRGVLFLAFAGEELGLLGSSYYVSHPRDPLEKAVAMINLDMVGRIRDRKIYVGGARTGTTFAETLESLKKDTDLKLETSDSAAGSSSDHTSFVAGHVPSLFFFSGLHGDYHKPSDTWDKIDAKASAGLLSFLASLTSRLAKDDGRAEFVKVEPPKSGTGASGYGPWFGSIPDFAEIKEGVRFSDVTAGSPAGKAGLKAGDILIEFDGKKIGNLYDFTYALNAKKAGDMVKVRILRGGIALDVEVTLQARR
jgi:hypothetical protein